MGLFTKKEEFMIKSVIDGKVRDLSTLKDGVFSEKMMGDGIVICAPKEAEKMTVVAPFSGEVTVAFPTGHAYGIKASNGIEVLIHIGIDTVNLNGEGFTPAVKQGQKIKTGSKLVTVDLTSVRQAVPTVDVIVIVTSGHKVINKASEIASVNEQLFDTK